MARRVLPFELRFGAFLVYSPRGESEVSIRSRRFRDGVKNDWPGCLEGVIGRLRGELPNTGLGEFLNPRATLVPVPRRAPLQKGALWPGRRICEVLVQNGLGKEVVPCLSRVSAVAKSAYAGPGERPGVQVHFDSMGVEKSLLAPERVILVDDFVTKGATLLAAAALVRETYPNATVLGFALVRTKGLVPEIERILEPCVGKISYRNGEVERDP